MGYLRKRDTGAVTDFLNPDSVEYQLLKAMRFTANVTAAAAPAGTTGLGTGGVPGVINLGQPVWEEISQLDAGFPDPAGGRVFVVALPGAALAAAETVSVLGAVNGVAGTLTDVEYVPNAAIPGVATNNRVITLNQVTVSAAPARVVTALAAITFDATHSNAGGSVPSPLVIGTAAFVVAPPNVLQVVSSVNGTGAIDPGGVLYGVYTRT